MYVNIYHSDAGGTWRYDDKDIEKLAEADAQFLSSFTKDHGSIKGVIISDLDVTVSK